MKNYNQENKEALLNFTKLGPGQHAYTKEDWTRLYFIYNLFSEVPKKDTGCNTCRRGVVNKLKAIRNTIISEAAYEAKMKALKKAHPEEKIIVVPMEEEKETEENG